MTKTLNELIAIVRFRGDMRSTVRFPDANLSTEIQAAFAEGYELVVQTNEGYYDTTGIVTTAIGADSVALPNGAWIVRAIDRVEGADRVPMPRVGVKDRNRYGTTLGRPVAHRLTARGIDLFPPPDAAYQLIVTYTPIAPTLDGTAREYYNSWEEYAINGALVRLYDNQGRDASIWQQQLGFQAARITRNADGRDSSGPEYLNLRDGWDDADDAPDRWRPGF